MSALRKPRNPFADPAVLFRAIPQLCTKFAEAPRVPADYLDGDTVRCVCGGVTDVPGGIMAGCAGRCGRWFVRVQDQEVRAARFWTDMPEELAA